MSDYRRSPARSAAQLLHKLIIGFGNGLELVSDAITWVVLAIGVCVGVSLTLASWVPLTGAGSDFWLWMAIWFATNTLVALSLRSWRRRRFGELTSRHVPGLKGACIYALAGWLGVLALVALWRAVTSDASSSAWKATMALVAVGTLLPTVVGLCRYVRERGEPSELDDV